MPRFPQGYHIIWGTHGVRLPGSEKKHVTRLQNEYGTPLPDPNPIMESCARGRMVDEPVRLDTAKRKLVEHAVRELAVRYAWTIHAIAVQSDHAHVVITAPREGQALRDAIKAAASKALNKAYESRRWWAEKGSAKYLWERQYFLNAVAYVARQRDF